MRRKGRIRLKPASLRAWSRWICGCRGRAVRASRRSSSTSRRSASIPGTEPGCLRSVAGCAAPRSRPWLKRRSPRRSLDRCPDRRRGALAAAAPRALVKNRGAAALGKFDDAATDFLGGQGTFRVGQRQAESGPVDIEDAARLRKVLRQCGDGRFDRSFPHPHFHPRTFANPRPPSTLLGRGNSIANARWMPERGASFADVETGGLLAAITDRAWRRACRRVVACSRSEQFAARKSQSCPISLRGGGR